MAKELTGKHVLLIFVVAFGTIIAVNLTLAFNAVSTFPGLEVKNSYVASQHFDERKAAQEALGWTVAGTHEAGQLRLTITGADGAPVEVAELEATLGRATHVADDLEPNLVFDGTAYVARLDIDDGNWNIRMKATAQDGTEFVQRVILDVIR